MYAELFTDSFGLEVVALRYFNVYGPRQRPDSMYAAAVPIFARRLLDGKPVTIFGDGGQTRDLINIRDVVRANLIASRHLRAAGKIFNVCTGVETRLLDLLDVMYELSRIHHPMNMRTAPGISTARGQPAESPV
jgi:UDP-glucose 4-epimerase